MDFARDRSIQKSTLENQYDPSRMISGWIFIIQNTFRIVFSYYNPYPGFCVILELVLITESGTG